MIEIKIEKEVSDFIEKLFYEQNATKSVLDYMIEKNINPEAISTQAERYSKLYSELEQAKRVAALKYAPIPLNKINFYNFNFNNNSIEFFELNEN